MEYLATKRTDPPKRNESNTPMPEYHEARAAFSNAESEMAIDNGIAKCASHNALEGRGIHWLAFAAAAMTNSSPTQAGTCNKGGISISNEHEEEGDFSDNEFSKNKHASGSKRKFQSQPTPATSKKSKSRKEADSKTSYSLVQKLEDLEAAKLSINAIKVNHRTPSISEEALRGVTMRPSRKWQAQFYFSGKSRYIGVFDSKEKANLAHEIVRDLLRTVSIRLVPLTPEEADEKFAVVKRVASTGANDEECLALAKSVTNDAEKDRFTLV